MKKDLEGDLGGLKNNSSYLTIHVGLNFSSLVRVGIGGTGTVNFYPASPPSFPMPNLKEENRIEKTIF